MPDTRMAYRYAVYLTPPEPWYGLGSLWLGRDAATGAPLERGSVAAAGGVEEATLCRWTDAPRRYGLHATLKPPFRLAEGQTAQGLDTAMRDLARRFQPFSISVQRQRLRGFLAWSLSTHDAACPTSPAGEPPPERACGAALLTTLADSCVSVLDAFRAPSSASDIDRRRHAGLTPAQDANLLRWGYPYVFETFAFHITLTAALDARELQTAESALLNLARSHALFVPLATALPCEMPVRDVSLFVQPAPDAPFVIARHYGFDGHIRDGAGARWLDKRP